MRLVEPAAPISFAFSSVRVIHRRTDIRKLILLILAVIAILASATAALAGGWSVVVVDKLPSYPVVGETLVIDFRVLAHGQTPLEGLEPSLVFVNQARRDMLTATAAPGSQPGRYTASFSLPSAGTWEWSIEVFEGPHTMPEIQVGGGQGSTPVESASSRWLWPAVALGIAGLCLPLIAGRRYPWAYGVTILALLSATVFIGIGSAQPSVESTHQQALDQVDFGGQLFQAKGCATCHANRKAPQVVPFTGVGPDLTKVTLPPEYLERWLQNPALIRPETAMPNLGLSEQEIQALVAFLTAP